MCGIVGAIAEREVSEILLEGLKRLEYRGYDSAGIALLNEPQGKVETLKAAGKVGVLAQSAKKKSLLGQVGIAHTRWATHGKPTKINAHPHCSDKQIAVVHNGIIENYELIRAKLTKKGYKFVSETDSETIVHLIHSERKGGKVSLLSAVHKAVKQFEGAYGICVADVTEPDKLIVARSGSPLVIGVGIGENFVASDPLALGQVTDRFIYLEEGDIAQVTLHKIDIWNGQRKVKRPISMIKSHRNDADKGKYRHYMLKEIYEQPQVIRDTLDGRIAGEKVLENAFGAKTPAVFDKVKHVQIVACGTSFHAGHVAKYWFESIARIPCSVDIASDYRYRDIIVPEGTLLVTVSQSGETADTLAALRFAKSFPMLVTSPYAMWQQAP